MKDLVTDVLKDDHRFIDHVFTKLKNGKWLETGAEQLETKTMFGNAAAALLGHIKFEEEILFPMFEEHSGMGSSQGPTAVMRYEHDQFKKLIEEAKTNIERGDGNKFRTTLGELMQGLGDHNVKEENILYPMTEQFVGPGQSKQLATESSQYLKGVLL